MVNPQCRCRISFYLPWQVGILLHVLYVPWPMNRGAYTLRAEPDSLLNNVGKIKITIREHRRQSAFCHVFIVP